MSAIPPNPPIPEKKKEIESTQSSTQVSKQAHVAQEKIQSAASEKEMDLSKKKVVSKEEITGTVKETMTAVDTVRSSLMRPILEHLSPQERNAIKNPESDMANFDMNKELLARYQTDPAFSRYIPKEFQGRDLNTLTPRECTECVLRTGTERNNVLNNSVIKMLPELQKRIPSMISIDLSRFFTNKEKAEAILDFLRTHLEECSQVNKLDFQNFKLEEVHPETLKLFPNLTYLRLDECNLTFIPSEIKHLKHLKELRCNNNKLSLLPDELGSLQELKDLWISSNQLTSLPPSIAQLKNLTHLALPYNGFNEIPSVIQSLQKLTSLFFSDNSIHTLPDWVRLMPILHDLRLMRNPIPRASIELLRLQMPQSVIYFNS